MLGTGTEAVWRDAYVGALVLWGSYTAVVIPLIHRGGRRLYIVFNPLGTVFAWTMFVGFVSNLAVGLAGWGFEPAFRPYVFGLMALLAGAGVTFMDVAVSDDL